MSVLSPDACDVKQDNINASRHVQSVMGSKCTNNHKGSELNNIANGQLMDLYLLYNTEMMDRNTICKYACFHTHASTLRLCSCPHCLNSSALDLC